MKQLKKTLLTLVALLAVTTGAWADVKVINYEIDHESLKVGDILVEGFSISGPKSVMFYFNAGRAKKGETLLNNDVSFYRYEISSVGTNAVITLSADAGDAAGTYTPIDENGQVANAWIVTSTNGSGNNDFHLSGYKYVAPTAASGPEVAWDKAEKTGTFTMPGGNVELEPEYYPQAAFAMSTDATPVELAPTAIADVPANTDAPIVTAGTVANIGTSVDKQGTLMYFVSQPTGNTVPDAPDYDTEGWSENVPTANGLAQGDVYVWYYIKGAEPANIADRTDDNTCSDSDIMPLGTTGFVTIAAEPTKVTMAVNDKTMGTAEVCGQSKVEWTPETWKGWNYDTKEYTVDDITMTSSKKAYIRESTEDDKYKNSLSFGVIYSSDESTVTFSTTGDPFSRIEFTMIDDYDEYNPHILPLDNWTIEGKSAVWEGEATKSLTLQSCSTNVSKITFYKGAIPDGVTVNGDGTFTVAKTATVTLKATPAEGYKFLYWEDDQTNTNPVREVTIESGMADMTYKAVFAEILYNVTFVDGIEDADKWKAEPNAAAKNTEIKVTYSGAKKVIGVKAEKKGGAVENAYLKWDADQKKLVATEMPAEVTTVANSNENVSWQAGTYVVDGEVNISGTITLSGDVNLIIKDGAKLTAQRISGAYKNLSIYGQAIQTGQLVVDNSGNDAIYGITTLEVHSAKVTATSSGSNRGGFFNIGTINVYGGSVDATATGDGYGISLNGSMDIYGGEVKAVGKGTSSKSYGFMSGSSSSTVTVYGGKLWAENADDKALKYINLEKGAGFTGKIETSDDNQSWDEYTDAETPTNKYVRVGY